jgi:hypothetical protein
MTSMQEAWDVFERSAYPERDADLRRDRQRVALAPCSNPSCPARVARGIPHCCDPCRAADHLAAIERPAIVPHSEACKVRQIERGVQL